MGSRGAFVNINKGDYRFVSGGQIYNAIGFDESSNVKYLVQSSGSIKVPDYSHTANRIYAIFDNKGNIKSIGISENHIKVKSIDLGHTHYEPTLGKTLTVHYHTDLYHRDPAKELSKSDWELVNSIIKIGKKYIWEKTNINA